MSCKEALSIFLDQVDYTANNCSPTDMVAAVLSVPVIKLCRIAIDEESVPSASNNSDYAAAARVICEWQMAVSAKETTLDIYRWNLSRLNSTGPNIA